MKRLPNNALHKSLIKFLKEKQPVPVFDYLPEMAALPFITLGNVTVADQSAKVVEETKVTVAIHIWSDYKEQDGDDGEEKVAIHHAKPEEEEGDEDANQ